LDFSILLAELTPIPSYAMIALVAIVLGGIQLRHDTASLPWLRLGFDDVIRQHQRFVYSRIKIDWSV